MKKEKTQEVKRNCCVRLPEELHARAKTWAYIQKMTLQQYIIKLIDEDVNNKKGKNNTKQSKVK
jgi:predicted HicB family RNase H-like nuclease